jgi:hypothetical protein
MTLAVPVCRSRAHERVDLSPFVRAEDGGAVRWPTQATLAWDEDILDVAWRCADPDPWGTLEERDAPLWTEEVVELFLAPGEATPRRYFEIEISPRGALFDAVVDSPHGDRRAMRVDPAWNAPGLERTVARTAGGWTAELRLPWQALVDGTPPPVWRLGLFRIERPPGGTPEFSAWSPTLVAPADFHRPARFGRLELLR